MCLTGFDLSPAAGRAVEGLAPAERGHHQGQAQAADGGLGRYAAPLPARRQAAQTPAAAQHDILSTSSRLLCHSCFFSCYDHFIIVIIIFVDRVHVAECFLFFPESRLYIIQLPPAAHMTMPSMSL